MKQVINGRVYSTETAKFICDLSSTTPYKNDHAYWEAELYQTKRGQYFLAGSGGPASMFNHAVGQNSWSGGSGIILLEPEEARGLAERELTADEYEAIFGQAVEG